MFRKKIAGSREAFDTLIGANTSFEGDIESEGTVRVDGRIKGNVNVSGDIFIGESAVISGNINANNVHLSGTVEGNIHSAGLLRIQSKAKLYGDIQVSRFVVDEGAFFQGKCSMIEPEYSEKVPVKTPGKKTGKDRKKSVLLDQAYEEEKTGS